MLKSSLLYVLFQGILLEYTEYYSCKTRWQKYMKETGIRDKYQ